MKFGLPKETLAMIVKLIASHAEIRCAKIYGSRALGTHKPGSDIDIAVYGNGKEPVLAAALAAELEELPMPYLIDVTHYEGVSHAGLKEHIDKHSIVIYQRGSNEHE